MNYTTVITEVTPEKVGIIKLNMPNKRNALSIRMRYDISTCLEEWEDSEEVSAVVFSGAGKAFSAGFDLKEFGEPGKLKEIYESSAKYHRAVWNFSKPTIAAIHGYAFGGAFDLATLCDLRITAQSTTFGHPEIKFGAPPLYTPLRWIVGMGIARDLCLTGRKFDENEALRIGLVSEIVNEEELENRALEIAKEIITAPIEALRITKKYMVENAGLGFEESFVNEHDKPFETSIIKQEEFLKLKK
ncbi:MAG: enoyl-CoA hydratase/isomerase family protein [bacterium]|nr:enoyl-CoA hydratase/isomerase family protein [bacterium]